MEITLSSPAIIKAMQLSNLRKKLEVVSSLASPKLTSEILPLTPLAQFARTRAWSVNTKTLPVVACLNNAEVVDLHSVSLTRSLAA